MEQMKRIVQDPDNIPEELHIVKDLPVDPLHELVDKGVRHTFMTVEESLVDMKESLDYLKEGMEVLLGK